MPDFTNPAWISLIVAAAGIVVTIVFNIRASRHAHNPYRAVVRPEAIRTGAPGCVVTLRNYGPGLALDLRLYAVSPVSMKASWRDPLQWLVRRDFVPGNGPFQLEKDQKAEYRFGLVDFSRPFTARWRTISGAYQSYAFIVAHDSSGRFSPVAGFRRRLRFTLSWWWHILLTPKELVRFWLLERGWLTRRACAGGQEERANEGERGAGHRGQGERGEDCK